MENPTEPDSESDTEDSAGLDHFTRMCLVAQIQYEMALRTISGDDGDTDDGDTDNDSEECDSRQNDEDINENVQVTLTKTSYDILVMRHTQTGNLGQTDKC